MARIPSIRNPNALIHLACSFLIGSSSFAYPSIPSVSNLCCERWWYMIAPSDLIDWRILIPRMT